MPLSERVKDRLENWKFIQAKYALLDDVVGGAEVTESERDTVEALAATFGDCGWFGYADHLGMAQIVRAAVWYLGVTGEPD